MPGTVIGPEDAVVNKEDKILLKTLVSNKESHNKQGNKLQIIQKYRKEGNL